MGVRRASPSGREVDSACAARESGSPERIPFTPKAVPMKERTCPVCLHALQEIPCEGEQVDFCQTCRGIFLDEGELDAISGLVSLWHQTPLREAEIDAVSEEEREREVRCPADDVPMEPTEIAGTTLDVCPACRGIWLDGGELTALHMAEKSIRENLELYIKLGQ